MAKLTTTDFTTLTANESGTVTTLNNNFAAVEAAMEKTLSRDGTSPNSMSADLDMNSNDILNVSTLYADSIIAASEIDATYRTYNPVEPQFNAAGDGATDDTAEIQATVDQLITDGGGVLLINNVHVISDNIIFDTTVPLVIKFEGKGKLLCNFATAKTAIDIQFTEDNYQTPGPLIIEPAVFLKTGSADALSTAISIAYNDVSAGGTNGPVVIGGAINGEGANYWLRGLFLDNCPHSKVERVNIRGRSGLSNTKYGAGIQFGDWAQGSRITDCDIRGFNDAILVDDAITDDIDGLESEGVKLINNKIQACTNGVNIELERAENSWRIQNNSISARTVGIKARNLPGLLIQGNEFQANDVTSDICDIQLIRDDGAVSPTYLSNSVITTISNNRSLTRPNVDFDITGITTGATTVITYANTSTTGTVAGVSVDGDGYVTITYGGAIADAEIRRSGFVTFSGVTSPTELNTKFKISDIDTTANTFRLYRSDEPISEFSLIDGSSWAAWSSNGTFVRTFSNGTLADGNVLHIDQCVGATDANGLVVVVANHDANAKTFTAKNYKTGADINSSTWGALDGRGRLTRYARFCEIKGGGHVLICDNMIQERAYIAHLWEETRNIEIRDNRRVRSGVYEVIPVKSESLYPETNFVSENGWSSTRLVQDGFALGNGVIDDTAALQSVLDEGKTVHLDPAKTYRITQWLQITQSDTGVDGHGAQIIMDTRSGYFDNSTYGAYGADAVGIAAIGTSGARLERVFVRNCRITTRAWVDDVYLKPILFEYVSEADISNNEIWNFSRGRGLITGNNWDGGSVRHNYLHDTYSNSTSGTGQNLQVTGIEFDNDSDSLTDLNGMRYSSRDVLIHGNEIRNITVGEAARQALGYQADGIMLGGVAITAAAKSKPSRGFTVSNNMIDNVGEGIDCMGHDNVIIGNRINRAFAYGIKLVHGASHNNVTGNVITNVGTAGAIVQPSNSAITGDYVPHADGNVIVGNIIRGINADVDWTGADGVVNFDESAEANPPGGASGAAGVRIEVVNGYPSQATNTLISNNLIDGESGTAVNGVFIEGNAGGSSTQRVIDNTITGVTNYYVDTQGYARIKHPQGGKTTTVTSSTYTVTLDDETVIVNYAGACALELSACALRGHRVLIKTVTANTVSSNSSDVVPLAGGAAGSSILSATAGKYAVLEGNGTNVEIIMGN